MILEPILSEGGDKSASNWYYNQLRNLCLEYNIIFIADEVQTGCMATGKQYAHQWWNLDTPPDIIT